MNNSPEDIQKMHESKAELYGLVCKITDDKDVFEIFADPHQYILMINNNKEHKSYHSSIENVLDDLLHYKEKKLMIKSTTKDLMSVKKAIEDSRKWMNEIVKPMFKNGSL